MSTTKDKLPRLNHILLKEVFKRLKLFNWNRTHAARSLDIGERTMRNYVNTLKKLGVDVPDNPKAVFGKAARPSAKGTGCPERHTSSSELKDQIVSREL